MHSCQKVFCVPCSTRITGTKEVCLFMTVGLEKLLLLGYVDFPPWLTAPISKPKMAPRWLTAPLSKPISS